MSSFIGDGNRLKKTGVPGLLFLVTVALTLLCFTVAQRYDDRRIQGAFDQLAHLKAQRVSLRVQGFERALIDLRGLFIANEAVSEAAFHRYLTGVDITKRYPSLYRIGYAPIVTDGNRAAIEKFIEARGKPNFRFPDQFDLYAAILYGFPAAGDALGMNLNVDSARLRAMSAARDYGTPHIAGPLNLRFEKVHNKGFLIYIPLYSTGPAPPDQTERRARLSGYLYAAFRVDDLVNSTIGEDLKQQLNLALYTGPLSDSQNLAFLSAPNPVLPSFIGSDNFLSIQHTQVAGQQWTFAFTPKPQFIEAYQSNLPAVILMGGLISSLLVAWLAFSVRRHLDAEERIKKQAYYDDLTGLPNRAALSKEIDQAIRQSTRTQQPFALLILELIGFRQINYTLGHVIGDELLKQVSARLRRVAPTESLVARISNVQFSILLCDVGPSQVIGITEFILKGFEVPFPVGDISYEVGAHAGIAFFPGHGDDSGALMQHADVALNQARISSRAYDLYDHSQDPYRPKRLALLGDVRSAAKEGQFQLYCQPKADLRTGTITGVEALIRWRHPQYGLVPPDQFIPLIEPTALIHPLTQYVIEAAIQQAYLWRQQNVFIPIAINLSVRNLLNPYLPEIINKALQAWGGDVSWIELEVTESNIMADPTTSVRVLNQIHKMGFKLYVDDFGTGYSSLNYLMKLPIDVIKIDHSFTMHMIDDQDATAIVRSTIEMAHGMRKKVVAEGTASKQIWDLLKTLNCDEAQGQYISLPFPTADFPGWLQTASWNKPTVSAGS